MGGGIPIGRIAGLTVAVHWSAAAIAGLFTWSLATVVLPEAAPDHSTLAYWVMGLVGAAALLASLLCHEMAHALVARRAGVEVEDITLWLFGGVARLGSEPANPHDDLAIAAAGPATSFGLSVGFGLVASVLAAVGADDLFVAVVAWLAAVNLLLTLFNLLPGAPLDGGRVLRAVLWRRHGDWTRAAVSAARAGQIVAYGVIWIGIVELLGGLIGGLWLVLIGWFMLNASRAEQMNAITRELLQGVRVRDAMTTSPQVAAGSVSVADFIDGYLLTHPHSAFPVQRDDGRTVGLLTLRQLRAVPAAARASTRIGDLAVPLDQVPVAAPDDLLVEALERDRRVDDPTGGRLLVFDGPSLVGIVTPADVTRLLEVRRSIGLGP